MVRDGESGVTYPQRDPLSRAQMALLSQFTKTRDASWFREELWNPVLGVAVVDMIRELADRGLLRPALLQEALEAAHSSVELKALAKERGLSRTGTKAVLSARLVEDDPEGMAATVATTAYWTCSEAGRAIAERHQDAEREERERAEAASLEQLAGGKLREAALTVADYESRRLFARGVGIDWERYEPARDVQLLRTVFEHVPGILRGMDPEALQPLRIAAGMMLLWGARGVGQWYPADLPTGTHLGPDAAARMFVFLAWNRRRLTADSPAGPPNKVRIVGVPDNSACSACRSVAGTVHPAKSAPELPLPDCTSVLGCRCNYAASWY